MFQMKEQTKTPEKEPNEMEISNLSDAEFNTLIIRMFNELRDRVGEFSENFNKDIGSIKTELENIKRTSQKLKIH